MKPLWQDIVLPRGDENQIWELFHENSKLSKSEYDLEIGRYGALTNEDLRKQIDGIHQSLLFEGYPIVQLPKPLALLDCPLGEAISTRNSALAMEPCTLTGEMIATILHYSYGITRESQDMTFPRPFRSVPSGGALYPLEIFFYSTHVKDLPAGLYHYNPVQNHLRRLRESDGSQRLSEAIIQPHIALGASLIVFITAVFERTIFKYGDRGYRFILLESGHVGQNMTLVCTALGLACLTIGGFFDRQVDNFLELDGVTHSTVYMLAAGNKRE
jgi:SagB-type dehydrogenase family enzyme